MKTRFIEKDPSRRVRSRPVPGLESGSGVKLEKAITINHPPDEIYAFWRNLENLPRFMSHLQSVTQTSDGFSHWVIKTEKGKSLEWDARIIEDQPPRMISWQSLPGSDVDNAGSVWFTAAPGGRGTVVKVQIKYSPPGGKVGAAIAKIFGDSAEKQIASDLYQLKSLLEAGEIPTVEGQTHGDPRSKS
jgi:uncharacterized membrane protein